MQIPLPCIVLSFQETLADTLKLAFLCFIHFKLGLALTMTDFFIQTCHTIRVLRLSLCRLSSVVDDNCVDQSAIEECSVTSSALYNKK